MRDCLGFEGGELELGCWLNLGRAPVVRLARVRTRPVPIPHLDQGWPTQIAQVPPRGYRRVLALAENLWLVETTG